MQTMFDFIVFTHPEFTNCKRTKNSSSKKRIWTDSENKLISNWLLKYGYKPSIIQRGLKYRSTCQVISHIQKLCNRFNKILDRSGIIVDKLLEQGFERMIQIHSILLQENIGNGIIYYYLSKSFGKSLDEMIQLFQEKDSAISS